MVAADGSSVAPDALAEPVVSAAGAATRPEDAVTEIGPAARVGATGSIVRPFDRFGRRQEETTDEAAGRILNGTTHLDGGTPLAVNGNGRPQARRGRFTRAAANGGNGWSTGATGHSANGRHAHGDEHPGENGAEEGLGRLEPLSVADSGASTPEDARKSELVDAGRRRP